MTLAMRADIPQANARDAWLYAEARNGTAWDTIRGRLNAKITAEHLDWGTLESGRAVKLAVDRYIDKQRLAPLPPRKRGRPENGTRP